MRKTIDLAVRTPEGDKVLEGLKVDKQTLENGKLLRAFVFEQVPEATDYNLPRAVSTVEKYRRAAHDRGHRLGAWVAARTEQFFGANSAVHTREA